MSQKYDSLLLVWKARRKTESQALLIICLLIALSGIANSRLLPLTLLAGQ
jgi:hypothetical protein